MVYMVKISSWMILVLLVTILALQHTIVMGQQTVSSGSISFFEVVHRSNMYIVRLNPRAYSYIYRNCYVIINYPENTFKKLVEDYVR